MLRTRPWSTELANGITGVAQVDLPGTEWEFVVFDKKEANAFAMPGGKVGVYTGLINLPTETKTKSPQS